MKLPRRQFLQLAAGAAALPAVSGVARAQTYPTRPITMIVPGAAGGPGDAIARVLVERMRGSLGQPKTGGVECCIEASRVSRSSRSKCSANRRAIAASNGVMQQSAANAAPIAPVAIRVRSRMGLSSWALRDIPRSWSRV
jgi:hypothetical protein